MANHLNTLEMRVKLSILQQLDTQITKSVMLVITYIAVIKAIMSSSICWTNKKKLLAVKSWSEAKSGEKRLVARRITTNGCTVSRPGVK